MAAVESPSSEPPRRQQRWYGLLWLVVALQIAIPASYYLRGARERDDERFSWRMFSAVRVKRCDVDLRVRQGEQWSDLDLDRLIHASWQTALERGRKRVIEHLLEMRCAAGHAEAAELLRSCKDARGKRLPRERTRLDCARRVWSFEAGK
jgi:hypothetical protein